MNVGKGRSPTESFKNPVWTTWCPSSMKTWTTGETPSREASPADFKTRTSSSAAASMTSGRIPEMGNWWSPTTNPRQTTKYCRPGATSVMSTMKATKSRWISMDTFSPKWGSTSPPPPTSSSAMPTERPKAFMGSLISTRS